MPSRSWRRSVGWPSSSRQNGAVLVHAGVAQAADAFQRVGAQQVRFVDDEDDLFAALGGLGGEQVLGLGDQRRVVKARAAAEAGHDRGVDAAQPDAGGAEVDDGVPGGVQAGDGGARGDGLAGAALAGDHADRLLADAPRDPRDGLAVRAMGVQHARREVLAERHPA